MTLTRRRFVLGMLGLLAVSGLGLGIAHWQPLRRVRERYYDLEVDVPPGPLDEETRATLLAVVTAFLGEPLVLAHYEQFLSWRAANLPGQRGLYQRVAGLLDGASQRANGCALRVCDPEARERLLGDLLRFRRSRPRRLAAVLTRRDLLLLDVHVLRPVLRLFARTDAWVRLGYRAWRGTPRGLEAYRRVPAVLEKRPA